MRRKASYSHYESDPLVDSIMRICVCIGGAFFVAGWIFAALEVF